MPRVRVCAICDKELGKVTPGLRVSEVKGDWRDHRGQVRFWLCAKCGAWVEAQIKSAQGVVG